MSYSALALLGAVAAVLLDLFVLRTKLVRSKAFWTSYAIMLGFQFGVNGLLTGIPVVRYDPAVILGWRLAYAPVEDVLFGFALISLTLSVWVRLGARAAPSARR